MVSILPPHIHIKGSRKGKVILKCGRKKAQSDSVTFFSLSLSFFLFMHYLCVLLTCFLVNLVLCYVLFNMFLFVCFQFCNFFFLIEKSEKYKNSVCFVYIDTYVPWMAIETKFSKLCVYCSLDEHLNA